MDIVLSLHPGFVVLVHIKGFVLSMEKIDVGVPAIVVGKTDVIPLAINRFDRCWSPQLPPQLLRSFSHLVLSLSPSAPLLPIRKTHKL